MSVTASHHIRVSSSEEGHVLSLADATDAGALPARDLTPHDAQMRPKGDVPTRLLYARIGDEEIAAVACTDSSFTEPLRDLLERVGAPSENSVFDLVRLDARDALGPDDLFLTGSPGDMIPHGPEGAATSSPAP